MNDRHLLKLLHPKEVIITWKYKGKTGKKVLNGNKSAIWWDEDTQQWNTFWWDEGNGSCDCNRIPLLINESTENCGKLVQIEDIEIIE